MWFFKVIAKKTSFWKKTGVGGAGCLGGGGRVPPSHFSKSAPRYEITPPVLDINKLWATSLPILSLLLLVCIF